MLNIPVKRNITLCSLVLLVFLCGCHSRSDKKSKVFHYNEQTGIASLDPSFAKNQSIMWPIHQLYNTLVEVDDSLQIVPSLATSWDISPDRLEYIFHLRNDVFFHDDACFPDGKGRKMVAADIVYSLGRITDKQVASPGAWIFNRKLDTLDAFSVVDDSTFRLRLLRPYNPILGILSMQYCSIVAPEAVKKYGTDFRRHPVGTGPFKFVAWEEGQALVLAKHPYYFEKDATGQRLPYIDGINVSFYDSKATEFLLFRQKKLEFINDIDASFKDEVLTKKGTLRKDWADKIKLNTSPYLNTEYLGFLFDTTNVLMKTSSLRFRKVRQAINYGFDRRKMILYLRNSLGTAAESGFVPMGLPSFDADAVTGYHYDPERCRQLLREAGFPDGKGLAPVKLYTVSIYAEMGNFIAKQLSEMGIRVEVEVVRKALLLEMTSNSRAAFFRGSWIADYPDAENYLSVFYSKNPAPPNYTRYNNPKFDAFFERALVEDNDSLRYRLYQQADQEMMNDAVIVPLWYDKAVHLVQKNVEGFHANALNLLELRKTIIR
jgi:ABC-type transport system substrate-binding protein